MTSRPAWRRLARMEARLTGDAVAAGVDEAGRGPLAGPVVAAAVILEPGGCWAQVRPGTRSRPSTSTSSGTARSRSTARRIASRLALRMLE